MKAALIFALCAAVALPAQQLRGRVTDTNGRPVHGASVWLLPDSLRPSPRLGGSESDDLGRFDFGTLPPTAHFAWIGRIGYDPVIVRLPATPGDSIVVALEDARVARARRDSLAYARHLAKVALARSRPRHWRCTLGDEVARKRAVAAYLGFVAADPQTMGRTGVEYGVPRDSAAFVRMFARPLSDKECRRFIEGFERHSSGFETDTIEVYRFGRALYLPWLGGYEGGFADLNGKILKVFIVPD